MHDTSQILLSILLKAISLKCFHNSLYYVFYFQDKIRGSLSALFLLFINIGFLLAYAIGPFTSYWGLTACGGILSLFYIPFTWLIPETPFFLAFKGKSHFGINSITFHFRVLNYNSFIPVLIDSIPNRRSIEDLFLNLMFHSRL